MFNHSAGVLSASFSVDGGSPSTITLLNRTSTSELPAEWTLHQALFQHTFPDTNAKAEHVLNVTVVEASESQVRFLILHAPASLYGGGVLKTGTDHALLIPMLLSIALPLRLCPHDGEHAHPAQGAAVQEDGGRGEEDGVEDRADRVGDCGRARCVVFVEEVEGEAEEGGERVWVLFFCLFPCFRIGLCFVSLSISLVHSLTLRFYFVVAEFTKA